MIITPWTKARRSAGNGGDCVEVRRVDSTIQVRDSKDRSGPVLMFAVPDWQHFLAAVQAGRFDLHHLLAAAAVSYAEGNQVDVRRVGDIILVRDGQQAGPALGFTEAEWRAFLDGAVNNEFRFTESGWRAYSPGVRV